MSGMLNVNNNKITNLSISNISKKYAINKKHLSSHIIWEYYTEYAEYMYEIDSGTEHEAKHDQNTRKVNILCDLTLSWLNSNANNHHKSATFIK